MNFFLTFFYDAQLILLPQSLRTPSHLKVNVLIAGLLGSDDHSFNNENELSITTSASPYSRPLVLYYVDMVGALQQIPYAGTNI